MHVSQHIVAPHPVCTARGGGDSGGSGFSGETDVSRGSAASVVQPAGQGAGSALCPRTEASPVQSALCYKSRGTQAQSRLLVEGSLVLQKAAKIAVNALTEAGSKAQEHRKEESLPSDERS